MDPVAILGLGRLRLWPPPAPMGISGPVKRDIDRAPFKGDIDIDRDRDVDVDIDVDRYLGCFKGGLEGSLGSAGGIETFMVLILISRK